MAGPAHDERDFEFATAFGLPIVEVVRGADDDEASSDRKGAYSGAGAMVTTPADFPFGIVSLAGGTSEGFGNSMGSFRLQQAGNGVGTAKLGRHKHGSDPVVPLVAWVRFGSQEQIDRSQSTLFSSHMQR